MVMWPVWSVSVPRGDELALLAASQRLSTAWFTEGFSHYFTVYPEWTPPYTEYLRPVANLLYWLFRPGSEWGFRAQLLTVNYGAHALVAGLVAGLVHGPMGQSGSKAILAALLVALSPAFWSTPMLVQPAFAMEAVACALCLGAVWAGERRLAWALAALTFAVMTKESALPVVAALALSALIRRTWAAAAGAIGVLLAWVAWRAAVFGGVGSAHALLIPFGPVREAWSLLTTVGASAAQHNEMGVRETYILVAVTALTVVLASSTTALALGLYHSRQLGRGTGPAMHWATWPTGVACSALYLLVTDVHLRYGYILIVLLVLWIFSWRAPVVWRGGWLLAAVLTPVTAAGLARIDLAPMRQEFEDVRLLLGTLRRLPPQGPPIYWAADHVGAYAGPDRVAALAGLTRPLIKLSSIAHRCGAEQWTQVRTELAPLADGLSVSTRLPDCARFVFEGSRLSGEQFDREGRIRRNAVLSYEMPGVDRNSRSLPARPSDLRLGATMRVQIQGPATVVWYDHANRDWKVFDHPPVTGHPPAESKRDP